MHNNLNSVILEGRIVSITKYDDRCHFTMLTCRLYRREDKVFCDDSYFNVYAEGKLGEIMNKKLDTGKEVRVVGRLVNVQYVGNNCASVEVYAEHIEDKPSTPEEEEDAEEET